MKKHERLAKKWRKREEHNWRKVLRRMPPPWAMMWKPSDYYDQLTTDQGLKDFYPYPAYQRVSHIRPFAIFRRVK